MKNYLIIVKHIKKFICHKASKGGKVMENFKRLLKYIKPYKFLILLAKLLMAQEKTNNNQAYMFRQLLEALKSHNNIFKIVSTATHR